MERWELLLFAVTEALRVLKMAHGESSSGIKNATNFTSVREHVAVNSKRYAVKTTVTVLAVEIDSDNDMPTAS